jgi:hypothetical protein
MKTFLDWINETFKKPTPPSPPKPYVMPTDDIIRSIYEDFDGILQKTGFSQNIQFNNNKFGGKSFVQVIEDDDDPDYPRLLFNATHLDKRNKVMATLEKVNAPRLKEHLAKYLR